ncbi:hypothetical protein TNCV_3534711 [Trichonephila clavipes]|nr:hypothetical protein TNCV_3534711 [Trichonephila clavipes]
MKTTEIAEIGSSTNLIFKIAVKNNFYTPDRSLASAGLSSFRALGAEDLRAPLALSDPRKVWLSLAYSSPEDG